MPGIKVIIVGAGLAGSLLANGLQREGVEVKVYDMLANHAKREGYQIRLGGNALTGFRACLDPESIRSLVAKFGRAGGKLSSAPVIRDKQFRPVLDLGRFTTYSKSAPINRGLLRDALADPLYDAGILQYDARYDRYDVVNKQIGLNNIQKVDSHMCFIAKSDLPTKRFLAMSPDLHEKPLMTFAENKVLYFAAYLPDKEEPGQPAKGTIEVEEVAFDDRMSSCMFGVFIPTDQCPEDILQADTETKWQFLSSSLRSFAPQ
ncbi:hypothetical protein LTR53_011351 [Teratosphaeriaceae sp. CCFEE 6253]|nr:hypothetical protein LTR53_011351 [Teratosphaeriaceae sp. CCFEE 6253]